MSVGLETSCSFDRIGLLELDEVSDFVLVFLIEASLEVFVVVLSLLFFQNLSEVSPAGQVLGGVRLVLGNLHSLGERRVQLAAPVDVDARGVHSPVSLLP